MNGRETIRSSANPLVARVRAALAGREAGTLVLQGDRLVDDALASRVVIEVVLVADDRDERANELVRRGVAVQRVERELLARVSSLATSPGCIALCAEPRSIDVETLALDARTLVLVVAGVGDPGNLGAIARAGEAFGASALVVARGGASPWNEKALRGSMGSLLRLAVAFGGDASDYASAFERRGVRQAIASTRGGVDPRTFDWRGPLALWTSGETGEIGSFAARFEPLTIPIASSVESLNVAVATAVLLFASGRAKGANA